MAPLLRAGELESQLEGLLARQREVLLNAPVVSGGTFDPTHYTQASRRAAFAVGALTAAALLAAIWCAAISAWCSHWRTRYSFPTLVLRLPLACCAALPCGVHLGESMCHAQMRNASLPSTCTQSQYKTASCRLACLLFLQNSIPQQTHARLPDRTSRRWGYMQFQAKRGAFVREAAAVSVLERQDPDTVRKLIAQARGLVERTQCPKRSVRMSYAILLKAPALKTRCRSSGTYQPCASSSRRRASPIL